MSLTFVKLAGRLLASALLLGPALAAAAPVRFILAPPSGSARIITMHHFLACQMRRRDAWSPTACPYWMPIRSGAVREISGQFCIYANWGPESIHRGAVLIRHAAPQQFVIRPSPNPPATACS